MRAPARWALALLPVVAAAGLWGATRGGLLGDPRLLVSASALRSDWILVAGALVSVLACAGLAIAARRDARWRRRLAEQAELHARDRRRLLARLDHELKNPLTAMRAALANVSAAASGPGQAAGLRSIEEQALRLSRLTAALRTIADVESGEVDRRPVDVGVLLEEVVDIAREQPGAGRVRLTLDLPQAPWPLPKVPGDWELLSMVAGNLLDNAVKYTPAGGRVEVRAREAGGGVLVEVADTGAGIEPEDLPHVWEELYRGRRARTVPGSGLGLALVRAVVERHGGSIAVESRVGQGTVVRVRLPGGPAGADPAARTQPVPIQPMPGQRDRTQKAAEPGT